MLEGEVTQVLCPAKHVAWLLVNQEFLEKREGVEGEGGGRKGGREGVEGGGGGRKGGSGGGRRREEGKEGVEGEGGVRKGGREWREGVEGVSACVVLAGHGG